MSCAKRPWYLHLTIIVAGALAMLSVPLVNGYPVLDADSGTYLRSAVTGLVPLDRPYWYGLFVRITSLNGSSLWGVVVAQAMLCSYVLWRCWRAFGNGRAWTYLLTILLLAPITGMGWYAGQIMSDTFTSTGVLAGVLLLLAPARPVERSCWAVLLVFVCWSHSSHMLIMPITFAMILTSMRLRKQWPVRSRVLLLTTTLILAWPGLYLANKAVSGEAFLSRYSHVFVMSGMAGSGMLRMWVEEHCPDDRYGICQYEDSLPTTQKEFMWSARSPLQWQGGPMAVREEYDAIISSTLRDPRYIAMHVRASLENTVRVLGIWRLADGIEGDYYRQDYSPTYGALKEYMPNELGNFLASAQNTGRGTLGLRWINMIYQFVLGISILLGVWLSRSDRRPQWTRILLFSAVTTIIIGAWVCGTLSTVDSRFMARTAWLLPFVVAMLLWDRKLTAVNVASSTT